VEEFGLLDALHPGRLDLGLAVPAPAARCRAAGAAVPAGVAGVAASGGHAPNGLRIPARFSFEGLLRSPRIAMQRNLLLQPHAQAQDYGEQIDDILALLRVATAPRTGWRRT